jgi:hypothetical protein
MLGLWTPPCNKGVAKPSRVSQVLMALVMVDEDLWLNTLVVPTVAVQN